MLHVVIMAGGSGTRFWPASRRATPKQLLRLAGQRSMIQQTVDRLGDLADPDRVLVVTNQNQVESIRAQLPELPATSIIGEPCKRDTAPCIGLAARLIEQRDPRGTMVVMPADHVIRPPDVFQDAVRFASGLVEPHPQRLVTFGIKPTYAAEVYGYIERAAALPSADTPSMIAYKVAQFREKPDAHTAAHYLESGNFYWNSGIFVWRVDTILEALADHQPEMAGRLKQIARAWGTPDQAETLRQEFSAIRGVSIDYAVMEHAREVVVVEAPYEWDDVGSWQALSRLRGVDDANNTIVGKHIGVNTQGTIVSGQQDHLIVTVGLSDCIVVHTSDATLVASKHQEESIREVVKLLEEKGWDAYL